jgi:hypothetical protein
MQDEVPSFNFELPVQIIFLRQGDALVRRDNPSLKFISVQIRERVRLVLHILIQIIESLRQLCKAPSRRTRPSAGEGGKKASHTDRVGKRRLDFRLAEHARSD